MCCRRSAKAATRSARPSTTSTARTTEVLVIDEWPDEATFQQFFDSTPEIKDLIDRAGAGQPDINFWHHLDVDDDIG